MGRPLLTELATVGITLSEIKPARQTETTQRWKFHVIYDGYPLPTRLEFSRRKNDHFQDCVSTPPSASLLAAQHVIPFVFTHYTAPAAYRQKINALAARTQVQARDVFDLHHLSPYAAAARDVPPKLLEQAIEQLSLIGFSMFHDQVVPFLPADLASHYTAPEAWKAIVEKVRHDLMAALLPFTP